jgi:hypothetical protein
VRIRSCRLMVGTVVVFPALLLACYEQPPIPRDKPLSCSSNAPGECPAGFSCIDNRICASQICELTEDCPEGLVCGRNGCGLPGSGDGGSDGAGPLGLPPDAGFVSDAGLPPGVGDAGAPVPTADAASAVDLGGGS